MKKAKSFAVAGCCSAVVQNALTKNVSLESCAVLVFISATLWKAASQVLLARLLVPVPRFSAVVQNYLDDLSKKVSLESCVVLAFVAATLWKAASLVAVPRSSAAVPKKNATILKKYIPLRRSIHRNIPENPSVQQAMWSMPRRNPSVVNEQWLK